MWSWSGNWDETGGDHGSLNLVQTGNVISGKSGSGMFTVPCSGEAHGRSAAITFFFGGQGVTLHMVMSDDGVYAKGIVQGGGDDRLWKRITPPQRLDTVMGGAPAVQTTTTPNPTTQTSQPVAPVTTSTQTKSLSPYVQDSNGAASCSIGDGYQTVHFSDGATYSGNFKGCRPLPGPAQYQQGSTVLNGFAEPIDDHTVRLRMGNAEATITLQILPR